VDRTFEDGREKKTERKKKRERSFSPFLQSRESPSEQKKKKESTSQPQGIHTPMIPENESSPPSRLPFKRGRQSLEKSRGRNSLHAAKKATEKKGASSEPQKTVAGVLASRGRSESASREKGGKKRVCNPFLYPKKEKRSLTESEGITAPDREEGSVVEASETAGGGKGAQSKKGETYVSL